MSDFEHSVASAYSNRATTPRLYWQLLRTYLVPYRLQLADLAVLIVVGLALDLIASRFSRDLIDSSMADQPNNTWVRLALFFLGAVVFKRLVGIAISGTTTWIGAHATNALRNQLTHPALSLDLTFHHQHLPGDMIQRLDSDVSMLATLFSRFMIAVGANILLLAGVLVFISIESLAAGVALTLFTGVIAFLLWLLRHRSTGSTRAHIIVQSKVLAFLEERLGGTENIAALGAAPTTLRTYVLLQREQVKRFVSQATYIFLFISTTTTDAEVGSLLAFAIGTYLFLNGQLSLGTVYLFFAYGQMIAFPFRTL